MKLEELVEQFARNVAVQTDALRQGNARTGNKHARQYTAAHQELRARGNAGRDALSVLLKHPRTDVRAMAEAFLLRYRTAEARAVLEEAAKEGGVAAIRVIMTLRRWDDGSWALDPE
ncbi:MAG TPA: DUF2019 domain-containing protein [Cystobacter sp.]|jgi:hypothetical protein